MFNFARGVYLHFQCVLVEGIIRIYDSDDVKIEPLMALDNEAL